MIHKFTETYQRTFAKLVTMRIILTIFHTVNTYLITGSWTQGLEVAGLAFIVNNILYWFHERAWNNFDWSRVEHSKRNFNERQWRTIGKLLTWRVLMIFSIGLIAFIVTGSWTMSAKIMSLTIILNIFIFWAHERLWNAVPWGKKIISN